jgi:hypothetical protein
MAAANSKDLSWEDAWVDERRRPLEDVITDRPTDLTKTWNKLLPSPPKYIWVIREYDFNGRRLPAGAREIADMEHAHHLILRVLQVHRLISIGGPAAYLRWDLLKNPDALLALFQALNLPAEWVSKFKEHSKSLIKRQQPVFPEIHNGGPFGRWVHEITKRKERAEGLFVQMFGDA